MKHLILLTAVALTLASCTFTPPPMDERYCQTMKRDFKSNERAYKACISQINRTKKKQTSTGQQVIEALFDVLVEW